MFPVAIAPEIRLHAYQPLAKAVDGGLRVATVLSLFAIPNQAYHHRRRGELAAQTGLQRWRERGA